jgi:ABC-2 type transport system permease protein
MIRFILSLFIPFRWFIEKMGADYNQFIRILELKLTLDNRRVNPMSKKAKNDQRNMLLMQSVTMIFLGVFFGIFLSMIKSPFTFFYLSHTFLMVMMAMTIISEFTTIIFDTSENVIIQPLPIKGNTISLARNAHVFIYLALMAFNLSVVSIIIAIVKFGIVSGLVFIFTIFLNVLFTLFLANIMYLGILRLATGEQLKNLLMYFQVAIAILFMAAYQFGIKMIDKSNIMNMVLPVHWYTFLVPPAFFSGFINGVTVRQNGLQDFIFIAEALLLPFVAIFLTGKYLTPVFNRKLMDLEQGDRMSKVKTEKSHLSLWYRLMSMLFAYGKEEKAAFKLMWKMTGRERLFKQTVLPSFGYIVIMIVLPFFNKPGSLSDLAKSDRYLFILYAFIFIASTLPGAILIGTNQHVSWVFKSLPMQSPSVFFKGSIKAAFSKFFMPFYILVTAAVCYVWGIRVLPDALIAFLVIYLFAILMYYFQNPVFPFASEKSAVQGGSAMIKVFGLLAVAAALGFLHNFLLHWFAYSNLMLIPVYVAIILYVNNVMVPGKISWKEVDRVNTY